MKKTKGLSNLQDKFKKFVLIDYINKVYFPIKKFQDRVVDYENSKRLLQSSFKEKTNP